MILPKVICGAWHRAGITTQGLGPPGCRGRHSGQIPDACPHPSPQVLVAVARTAMARACELGLLLALLLPMVGTSVPGTVVRLNKAMLSYGKGRDCCAVLHECVHVIPCLYVCVQS